jgi:hypothetical protein
LFRQLQDFGWTLGDFLYYVFQDKDEQGEKITSRSDMHTQMASKFVGGFCKHSPVDIIEIWVRSPWGIPKEGRWERDEMFSIEVDFRKVKPARPGITSFAVQMVFEKLERDIREGVKKANGLHTFTTGACKMINDNFGAQTFLDATTALKEHQSLAWNLLVKLATPHPQVKGSEIATRQYRPPEMVCNCLMGVYLLAC